MPAAASRSNRRPTSARCRPSFPTSPSSSRVACDDGGPLPEALAASAAGARFLYVLPNFQNPSGRSISAGRRAELAARRRERRRADRRGQPVRRPLVRRRAAGADRDALARRDDLPRQLLEGARAGASPRLRDRAGGGVRQAGAGQAGGRPAHAGIQPAHRPRDRSLAAFSTRTCRRSAAATASSATRCRRRSSPTCRPAGRSRVAGRCRAAACSSGSSCRTASTARRCSSRRSRAASPSFRARRSSPARRARTPCACRSSPSAPT